MFFKKIIKLGVRVNISINGVISFSLFFLKTRNNINIIEIVIAMSIGTSGPQPTTGEQR